MKHKTTLTAEQIEALKKQGHGPLYLVDADSEHQYVLLSAEQYQRYKALFESDEFDISETYAAQDEVASQVWDDPDLDDYNAHRTDA